MAILLYEENLYHKTTIYATDINEVALKGASRGVFPIDKMQTYTANYLKAGGSRSFSEYYRAEGSEVIFHPFLSERVVFSRHNLVTDGSINEFNVIICRNVLIYFDKTLQNRVHKLFFESLGEEGILGLGNKESIRFSDHQNSYVELGSKDKLYIKKG
ncbi:hypothetical protein N752_14955 [Desulforamulus aquiferis]|nr:CheR family methyltransferase [Desulforamulus aquiferis]RYD04669.1 hypothetical protein N752_14955 [Desulforamulus aquiferis]